MYKLEGAGQEPLMVSNWAVPHFFLLSFFILFITFALLLLYFTLFQSLSFPNLNPLVLSFFPDSPPHPTRGTGVSKWLQGT